MTVTLAFLAILMAVFVAWLLRQSLNVRPWVAASEKTGHVPHLPAALTAPRVGLGVFLAVATSVFALSISAYLMRMGHGHGHGTDWRSLPEPTLLWVNSGILVLASLALQWAWNATRRNDPAGLRLGLLGGGVCTIAFIGGQYFAWLQLHAAGYYAAANPAYAFFYLLTALHALHLLGGLVAWTRVMHRAWRGTTPVQLRGSMELCAVYWHFLLVVWAVLFALVLAT